MSERIIYEYLVTKDWFGSLEKGCRLYYNHNKGGYMYHTEYSSINKGDKYTSYGENSMDYIINLDVADKYLEQGELIAGPVLGGLIPNTK